MKHEALARAMSHLDDDLILQAHNGALLRQAMLLRRRLIRIGVIAACLLLTVCTAWLFVPAQVQVTFPGDGESLSYPEEAAAVHDLRGVQPLEVEFSVAVSRTVRIRTDGGTFSLTKSGEASPFLQESDSAKARGKLTVQWQIPSPDKEKRYAFYVGDKAVAALFYDGQSAAWILENETK